jgi:LysM repeat protein
MISGLAWLAAIIACAAALLMAYRMVHGRAGSAAVLPAVQSPLRFDAAPSDLPSLPTPTLFAVERRPQAHTTIPQRARQDVTEYTVQKGDSVFEIAKKFNLKPETVLWSNYAQLKDSPDMISVGMELRIPPVDGLLYQWQPGDSLQSVASQFKTDAQSIINWPGNGLDLIDPQVKEGALLIVPGGQREFRQWIIPTIPRGAAGVAASVYGGGACTGSFEGGAMGTGTFIWPAGNHFLSGNDYWPGHLAIDIAAGAGTPLVAADAGVVVFAGWANGGYGNTVMIDHGNGYQTLYAHMDSVNVHCGQSVNQGGTIGMAGTTGNSTGVHLHFEVRYMGGFVSPWTVLPAP